MRGLTVLSTALLALAGVTSVALAGSTEWIGTGDTSLGISGDGRFVVFYSAASNLVAGDTVWLRNVIGIRRVGRSGRTPGASRASSARLS
jgi:hypothetical protein